MDINPKHFWIGMDMNTNVTVFKDKPVWLDEAESFIPKNKSPMLGVAHTPFDNTDVIDDFERMFNFRPGMLVRYAPAEVYNYGKCPCCGKDMDGKKKNLD